jgi:membrane associated rhomboid family serine protease
MAFRSNGPVMLALPPFRGMTRRLILIALSVFFGSIVLGLIAPKALVLVLGYLALTPALALPRELWQLATYSFMPMSLLSTLFALLSLWFFGSALEDEQGSRWLLEYFIVASVGGGLLASLLALTRVLQLDPANSTAGLWPAVMAILLAFARFHPEQELRFNFILTLKAKYLAAIYLLIYLASTLLGGDRLGALTAVCAALCGFLYLRFAPRKGVQFAASEGWFGLRNAFYRAKRRRAAKKFTVYMKKQGKDVSLDAAGRYIDPLEERKGDPNDHKWMN